MIKRTALSITLFVMGFYAGAFAHGVITETSFHGKVVVIRSSFSPTQPLVDGLVTIYSPADQENAWQTGRTDKTGNFAFMPEVDGEWIFVVDDQKGHMKRLTVPVQFDVTAEQEIDTNTIEVVPESPEVGLSKTHRVIFGLALIFGITGIFYGLKARKTSKKE
jgi:nickel transport protein